mgnify:CR=1 FL=1|tara:strand:+ start:236 stop:829 length:594 start_codon:yes stop_codon:yes gene_type:complete
MYRYTNDVQTQTEDLNTKITWPDVFKPFSTFFIFVIFINIILELLRDNKNRLPSVNVMLLELSIHTIYLIGLNLTTYLFILKILNKNVGKKKRFLDIFSSAIIIRYLYFGNNITNNFQKKLFVLRFIIHMITLSPMSEITLDCISMSINYQSRSFNDKNYAPTEGAIRFGLAHYIVLFTEISRLMYSLYYVIFKKII